jgi:hypothetical protein
MSTTHASPSKPSLSSLTAQILPTTHLARPLPPHATQPSLSSQISSLLLHPTLEATLHLLNADLPSAHFLVRHMQAAPAVEGMLLHGILHRCEGDFDNARAWASDVRDACEGWVPKHQGEEKLDDEMKAKISGGEGVEESLVEFVYQNMDGGLEKLIDDVERFRTKGRKVSEGEEEAIEKRIRQEMQRVLEWCSKKFGDGAWLDASEAWVQNSEEVHQMSNDMTSGNKGWREF